MSDATGSSRPEGLAARGSIVMELHTSQDGPTPTRLLHFEGSAPWDNLISLYLNADHSISIEVQLGERRSYGRIDSAPEFSSENIRITFSWDAPSRAALLSVEGLESGYISQAIVDHPLPIPFDDLMGLCQRDNWSVNDNRIDHVAISDDFQPVGPTPGLSEGNEILTLDGFKPIERLQLGDRVATASGRFAKVRWIIGQDLPAAGRNSPVRLRAPYLGIERDVIVSAAQKVMIEGSDAEYLFGEDAVLISADQLCSTHAGEPADDGPLTRYYQVLLDRHDCLNMSGLWCESLYVGALASNRHVLMTTRLSQLSPSAMPRHQARIRPTLRNYEAQSLVEALIA